MKFSIDIKGDWFGAVVVIVLLAIVFAWSFSGGIGYVETRWSTACVDAGYDWGEIDGTSFTCHFDVRDGMPLHNTGEA